MPIRERNGRWQVDVAFGGLRKQLSVGTEIEAKRLEPELLRDLQAEAAGKESKKWTLKTAIEKTQSLFWDDDKSPPTHQKNINSIYRYFKKDTLISDIDTDAVDNWIAQLIKEENSGATINKKLTALSKVMSVAMDRGALDKKPKFTRRREVGGRIRWVTYEEERVLIDLLTQWGMSDHIDVVKTLIDTGCRPGELYGLKSPEVNFETNTITFWATKNDAPRSVPMTLRVQEILRRRTKNSVRPFPYSDMWMRTQWEKARILMNLQDDPGFVVYACRHTCASRMAQKGVPIQVIKEWLGHKNIKQTLQYAHLCPATLQSGLKALEDNGTQIPKLG